jgi:hypothetical protein
MVKKYMKKVRDFLVVSFLGILIINLTLISAVYILFEYGSVTLYPGEKYTLNIPFFGISNAPEICGKAQKTNGEVLEGVNVSVYYDDELVEKETTDSDGEYCITLPELTTSRKYDIFIEYDNETPEALTLGSNDYALNFLNYRTFSKSNDGWAVLSGTIDNEDANVENGRFEINLKYYNTSREPPQWVEIFDYKKYAVNIESGESYEVPSEELNVSWQIPDDALIGRYKFYIKSSFNAKERTKDVYFNITE